LSKHNTPFNEEKRRRKDAAYRWRKDSPHEEKERKRKEELREHEQERQLEQEDKSSVP